MQNTLTVPTAQRLRELLNYDPDTGKITWRVRASSRRHPGDEAGHVRATKYGNSYRSINPQCGANYQAHRVAWCMVTGEWPEGEIDHINGDGADNRWENLREVSSRQNKQNLKRRADNTSGVMGVHWDAVRNRWRATIKLPDSRPYLGIYRDWFDAVCARKSAENRHGFHPNHGRVA